MISLLGKQTIVSPTLDLLPCDTQSESWQSAWVILIDLSFTKIVLLPFWVSTVNVASSFEDDKGIFLYSFPSTSIIACIES